MDSLNIPKNILNLLFSLKPELDINSYNHTLKKLKDLPKIYEENKDSLIKKTHNEYNNLTKIFITHMNDYIYPDYYTNNKVLIIISNLIITFDENEYIPYKIISEDNSEQILYYLIHK